MTNDKTTQSKIELRRKLKTKRATIDLTRKQVADKKIIDQLQRLPEFIQAQYLFTYLSTTEEVNTLPLLYQTPPHIKCLAVPKITSKTMMVAIPIDYHDELQIDKLGILSPISDKVCPVAFDIAVTPGLGFDRAGYRIGYGRGYYDRWFNFNAVKSKVGLCYSDLLMDKLPHETFDIPIDILITEDEILRINNN